MTEFLEDSLFAGVTISLLAYILGYFLKKKFKLGFLNPLLISIAATIVVLVVADVDYEVYNKGASYISWFLTPATVCLAIPLYEQWQLLKDNFKAVLFGIVSGVITSLATVFVLAKLMGLTHEEYVTLLPKSITTAIGMGVSDDPDLLHMARQKKSPAWHFDRIFRCPHRSSCITRTQPDTTSPITSVESPALKI